MSPAEVFGGPWNPAIFLYNNRDDKVASDVQSTVEAFALALAMGNVFFD